MDEALGDIADGDREEWQEPQGAWSDRALTGAG